jgi:membrane protease YdiL (CAAX protease family)
MILFAADTPQVHHVWAWLIVIFFIVATYAAWFFLGARLAKGLPLLKNSEPGHIVPWTMWDLVAVFWFWLCMLFALQVVLFFAMPSSEKPKKSAEEFAKVEKTAEIKQPKPEKQETDRVRKNESDEQKGATASSEEERTEHPLTQLLARKKYSALLVAIIVAMIVAPIAEEFLYRLLLIGCMEAAEIRLRRDWRSTALGIPIGAIPIFLSSLLFALLHLRFGIRKFDETQLMISMVFSVIMNMAVVTFAIVWIRKRTGATARDFGWDSRFFWKDVATGVVAFFTVAGPILLLQYILMYYVLPPWIAPDPIPLFFLAIALGTLYQRTHRLVPSIVLHALLNSSSVAAMWFK